MQSAAGLFSSCVGWLYIAVLLSLATPSLVLAERRDTARAEVVRVQQIVDLLKARLTITSDVATTIVEKNELLVSVKPVAGRQNSFELSFEAAFLATLSEEDLHAVVAHELGHVWIFTHHPYLQTEQQANAVAMRVVSRESLEKVYGKVWTGGTKGDLARFLGQ
jgi:hypothetical protein